MIPLLDHRPTTNAIMGLTFANYVIKPFFPDCGNPDDAVRLLAAAAICKQFIINVNQSSQTFLRQVS